MKTGDFDISELIGRLNGILSDSGKADYIFDKTSYRPVTREIKRRIAEYGKGLGFTTCTSGVDGCDAEFLYDLVWYTMYEKSDTEDYYFMKSMDLALECEISYTKWGDIKHDFDKLLVANSPLKIMIFRYDPGSCDSIISYCKEAIIRYHGFNDPSYHLLVWHEENEAEFRPAVL